jgi:gamma-glutamyl phosphate reductase
MNHREKVAIRKDIFKEKKAAVTTATAATTAATAATTAATAAATTATTATSNDYDTDFSDSDLPILEKVD